MMTFNDDTIRAVVVAGTKCKINQNTIHRNNVQLHELISTHFPAFCTFTNVTQSINKQCWTELALYVSNAKCKPMPIQTHILYIAWLCQSF
jgi:hypothetical protein